ncbi:hypothetical protein [Asanoa iriomotensis]|uniref:Uncharacterized protein n=1 Tax=Asanoa iriomotensis TaxID=234613 RepID=A0ABQ4CGF3_9ACTN|nr:hypothetical protein [Asanoa iriomotensis]GIF61835.1 hypothetical protein Air01nite_79300 [Asanoa iriomotensis]
MLRGVQRVMDVVRDGLAFLADQIADLLGEILVALAACGLLLLAWWGFRTAPYVTASIAVGLLLFAGYGVNAYLRDVRGGKLVGRMGGAAIVAAAVTGLLLSYLPACACLG